MPDKQNRPADRKLGDEWGDWTGEADPRSADSSEKAATFLSLASGILFIAAALILLGWFLVKPRVEQLDLSAARYAGWILMGFITGLLISLFFEGAVLMKRGRSFFPYRWTEKLLLLLLSRSLWLGGKLGISRDRIGNSFLKVHNLVTKEYLREKRDGRMLVLLPRCLKKEARQELTDRLAGSDCRIYTAAGGEEARKAIREHRPSVILAVACERDLMSGVREIAEKIPVLAIPNKRPEGPCKNTEISLEELEEALKALKL